MENEFDNWPDFQDRVQYIHNKLKAFENLWFEYIQWDLELEIAHLRRASADVIAELGLMDLIVKHEGSLDEIYHDLDAEQSEILGIQNMEDLKMEVTELSTLTVEELGDEFNYQVKTFMGYEENLRQLEKSIRCYITFYDGAFEDIQYFEEMIEGLVDSAGINYHIARETKGVDENGFDFHGYYIDFFTN